MLIAHIVVHSSADTSHGSGEYLGICQTRRPAQDGDKRIRELPGAKRNESRRLERRSDDQSERLELLVAAVEFDTEPGLVVQASDAWIIGAFAGLVSA